MPVRLSHLLVGLMSITVRQIVAGIKRGAWAVIIQLAVEDQQRS